MRWISLIDDDVSFMSLNRWGPNGWKFITACAFAYPATPEQHHKDKMRNFLRSMGHVLPCLRCRAHYTRNVATLDDTALESRENLLRWINQTRNNINETEGKPTVTFDEMIRECLTGCKEDCRFRISKQKLTSAILIVLFVLLLIGIIHVATSP